MGLKPRYGALLGVVLITASVCCYYVSTYNPEPEVVVKAPEVKADGVLLWLNSLLDDDFEKCDSLLDDKSGAFYSEELDKVIVDSRYYDYLLKKLSDCILSAEITEVNNGDYTIEIEYYPYKLINHLETVPDITESIQKFYNDELDSDSFKALLEDKYYETYVSNCFILSDVIEKKVLILSEKEKNGVTCVSGTKSFVSSLLSDSNIKHNTEVFTSDIRDVFSEVIKAN